MSGRGLTVRTRMIILTIMIDYNNTDLYEHHVYNTGDQIWIDRKSNKVVKYITHDGLEWSKDGKSTLWVKD